MDHSHAPLSMEFSIQEYWSGLPFPPPGDPPNPGMELASLMSPALAGRFFTTSATWETQPRPCQFIQPYEAHHKLHLCLYLLTISTLFILTRRCWPPCYNPICQAASAQNLCTCCFPCLESLSQNVWIISSLHWGRKCFLDHPPTQIVNILILFILL